jgi:SSS family solute:Na+ symporter
MPLYKKPLSKERHMKWIKMSIIGVACFIFIWSSIFEFNERLMMYVTITNAIFLSGSGAAIIGGLYWKRGTTAAAFTAVIIGAGLTGLGFLLRGIYPAFPIEGHWIFAIAIFISIISYIVVSLLTSKSSFDMDQMLHRGKYAVDGNGIIIPEKAATGWRKWLGISNEFSRRDVFVYLLAFMFPLVYFVAFVVMLLCSIFIPRLGGTFDDMTWLKFWKLYTYVSLILACVFAIWLLIGGSRDVVSMIKTLRTVHRNDVDDGRVSGHHNLADEKLMLAMNENKDQKNDA